MDSSEQWGWMENVFEHVRASRFMIYTSMVHIHVNLTDRKTVPFYRHGTGNYPSIIVRLSLYNILVWKGYMTQTFLLYEWRCVATGCIAIKEITVFIWETMSNSKSEPFLYGLHFSVETDMHQYIISLRKFIRGKCPTLLSNVNHTKSGFYLHNTEGLKNK